MHLKRGHLYTADLNPRFGSEAGKIRPVLVMRTNLINADHPSTLVCPLTTKVRPEVQVLRVHLRKGEAGLQEVSDIMIDQLRAIDNRRFKKEIGHLASARLTEVEEKLKLILDLV